MIKYLILDGERVVDTFVTDSLEYTVTYPGFDTVFVAVDDKTWQDVVDNTDRYMYKNGKLEKE